MNRYLLFYWYIPSNGIYAKSYDFHLYCLNKYKDRFNNETFILSIDDLSRTDLINEAKERLKIIFPNAEFQILQNNPNIRESSTVYHLLKDLEKYNGNIFFGHSKGASNNQIGELYEWIYSLYYFNLNDIDLVDNKLNSHLSVGTLKKIFDFKSFAIFNQLDFDINKYFWHYSGTFFWINPVKLNKFLKDNNIEIDKRVHRWYSETVLGNLYHSKYAYAIGYDIPEYDLYNKCDYILKNIMLEDSEYKKFKESFEETKKELDL